MNEIRPRAPYDLPTNPPYSTTTTIETIDHFNSDQAQNLHETRTTPSLSKYMTVGAVASIGTLLTYSALSTENWEEALRAETHDYTHRVIGAEHLYQQYNDQCDNRLPELPSTNEYCTWQGLTSVFSRWYDEVAAIPTLPKVSEFKTIEGQATAAIAPIVLALCAWSLVKIVRDTPKN